MEQDYVLWHVSNVLTQNVGTYNTYDEAYEVAKELNDKYNDEGNYWEEKDRFYIVEDNLRCARRSMFSQFERQNSVS